MSLRVIPFRPELGPTFKHINAQWIEAMFTMEASDRALLDDPQGAIIEKGGHIWFVEHETIGIVGTCALVRRGQGVFELTKMGVLESARGQKAGEFLLAAVIEEAQALKVSTLFLLTSSVCEAAIHLYRKHGFQDDADVMDTYGKSYARCNVAMRWDPSSL